MYFQIFGRYFHITFPKMFSNVHFPQQCMRVPISITFSKAGFFESLTFLLIAWVKHFILFYILRRHST